MWNRSSNKKRKHTKIIEGHNEIYDKDITREQKRISTNNVIGHKMLKKIQKLLPSNINKNIETNMSVLLGDILEKNIFHPRHENLATDVNIITSNVDPASEIIKLLSIKKLDIQISKIEEFKILENNEFFKKGENDSLFLMTISSVIFLNYETWRIILNHTCVFYSWIDQNGDLTLYIVLRFINEENEDKDSTESMSFANNNNTIISTNNNNGINVSPNKTDQMQSKKLEIWPIIKKRDNLETQNPFAYSDSNIKTYQLEGFSTLKDKEKEIVTFISTAIYKSRKIMKNVKVSLSFDDYISSNEILCDYDDFLKANNINKKLRSVNILGSLSIKLEELLSRDETFEKKNEIITKSIILPYYKLFESFSKYEEDNLIRGGGGDDGESLMGDIILEVSNSPQLSLNFLSDNLCLYSNSIKDIFFYSREFIEKRHLVGQIHFIINRVDIKNVAFNFNKKRNMN